MDKIGLGSNSRTAWIHHPYQLEDIGVVGEALLVYDCYDDYFAHATGRRLADLKRRHAAILQRADLVLAASEPLLHAMHGQARQTMLLPNAADDELFLPGKYGQPLVPPELEHLPHPIIGFVGRVGQWLDFELLAELAERRRDWSFAFLGPHDGDRRLLSCPGYAHFKAAENLYLLGPRGHSSVPAYMHAFDVCIIPYLLDGQVPSSSPLKLYEYLAAGKPVVSVPISDVARFQPLVRIAIDAGAFECAIADSLEPEDGGLKERRLEIARQNSWPRRAQCVIEAIDQLLRQLPA
jgi:glycosyltransferase involved in cell wall biosynthesis